LTQDFLDFLYPPLCLVCEQRLKGGEKLVCHSCWERLPRFDQSSEETLLIQKQGEIYFKRFQVAFVFNRELQKIVHGLKYQRMKSLAENLGQLSAEALKTDKELCSVDYLVPVPLHKAKLRERGYNQSWLLCQAMSKALGIPCSNRFLKRRRYTPSQTQLAAQRRVENVRGAFWADETRVRGKSFVIVDDLITTGATVNECAKALKEAGAREVYVFAAARPV